MQYICSVIIPFYKYQGTGNDFVIIDNRTKVFPSSNQALIQSICDRRFGVGSDGLILLENHEEADFMMNYYNADGQQGSFCGNGGRCVVAFAHHLEIINNKTLFAAFDGLHHGSIIDNIVSLSMSDVKNVKLHPKHVFLDTGSPHHIEFVDDTDAVDVQERGRAIAHHVDYGDEGTNVNFVSIGQGRSISVRTFERGVENETLSCGTGVTAAAIAAFAKSKVSNSKIDVTTLGGVLAVSFVLEKKLYRDVVLTGPTQLVFSGTLNI